MATPKQQSTFLNNIVPLANKYGAAYGIAPGLIISQAALESNWGVSAPQNNYFGIKGKGGTQTTKEYINGKWITITDSFKGYSSLEDSVKGYVDFLTKNPRYKDVFGKEAPQAIGAVAKAGYATDPKYADKLTSIFNNLGSKGAKVNPLSTIPTLPQITNAVTNTVTDIVKGAETIAKDAGKTVGDTIDGVKEKAGEATDGVTGLVSGFTNSITSLGNFFAKLFRIETGARLVIVLIGVLLVGAAVVTFLKGGSALPEGTNVNLSLI